MADRVVLVTTGTKGDLNPFLALGKGLLDRGLNPLIATNEDHEEATRAQGLDFIAISAPDYPQSNRDVARFKTEIRNPSRDRVNALFSDMVAQGHTPVILCRTDNFMSVVCARKFGTPYILVNLQPQLISNPWEPQSFKNSWRVKSYNECLDRAGLEPVEDITEAYSCAEFTLSLFPRWYGLPQSVLWTCGNAVGFPFLSDQRRLSDPGLDSFIERFGPPLVFAPGTGITDVDPHLVTAREICRLTAMPGVFMSPYLPESESHEAVGPVLIRNYVNFTNFLHRAAVILHHGGMGTTAQALRAGVPQIVRPVEYDQPDNAARVLALGLGEVAEPSLPHAEVARLVKQVLVDKALHGRIAEVAQKIGDEDAVAKACDLVEAFLRRRASFGRLLKTAV